MLPVLFSIVATASPNTVPTGASPFEIDHPSHAVFTFATLSLAGLFQLVIEPELPGGLACEPAPGHTRCDPSGLNELDRTVVGNNSRDWRQISDAGLWGTLLLGAGATALDAWLATGDSPGWDFLTDALVIAEATTMAIGATLILKVAIRRPRPNHYTEGAPVGGFDQRLSFPSGHASTTAAIATAYATTFSLRHPDSPWRFLVYGAAAGLSLVTGFARVGGGRHFYTDVLAGWVIGAACGFLIPLWHRPGSDTSTPAVGIAPAVVDGSYRVMLSGSF